MEVTMSRLSILTLNTRYTLQIESLRQASLPQFQRGIYDGIQSLLFIGDQNLFLLNRLNYLEQVNIYFIFTSHQFTTFLLSSLCYLKTSDSLQTHITLNSLSPHHRRNFCPNFVSPR